MITILIVKKSFDKTTEKYRTKKINLDANST